MKKHILVFVLLIALLIPGEVNEVESGDNVVCGMTLIGWQMCQEWYLLDRCDGGIENVHFNLMLPNQNGRYIKIVNPRCNNVCVDCGDGTTNCEWCIVSCSDIYFIDSCAECGEESYSNSNAIVMSYVLDPEPGQEVYDPCCGSGGLLIKCFLRFRDKYGDKTSTAPLRFYGQETLHPTYAMAKMNMFIHDMETEIRLGDTMVRPFTNVDGSLRKFDLVTANPMWNQNFSRDVYENDPFDRFQSGYPPPSSADWGWTSTAWDCHTA